jgi:endonuclease/exonuclease/phosphatase family metal-dependent hydrolase
MQPFGNEPTRPTALLGDGLNIFSRLELAETTRVAWRACVDTEADCLAMKGFSHTPARIADGLAVHLYDLHMEAGGSAEDDQARDAGIDQLIAFIAEHSRDVAVIVAGDFNLHTTEEPAKSQLARLLRSAELRDSCEQLDCSMPGNIDKVLYRSSSQLRLAPHSWVRDTQEFVTTDGEPLSDHAPVSVRFSWRFFWSAER